VITAPATQKAILLSSAQGLKKERREGGFENEEVKVPMNIEKLGEELLDL